jgi:hypothetical protein
MIQFRAFKRRQQGTLRMKNQSSPGYPWIPKPERHVSRLHRLVDDSPQLIAKGVEVDLIAQVRAKTLKGAGGIVLSAVEATVDNGLDAATCGPEESGDGKCRDCDGEAAARRQRR